MEKTFRIMRIISHRGNLNGEPESENSLSSIMRALENGFDVEVDIWKIGDDDLWLGHDNPQYFIIDKSILNDTRLWIHAKNLEALQYLCEHFPESNFFWHQEDDFTLTSTNYIWTYPEKDVGKRSIIVAQTYDQLDLILETYAYGVCTDDPIYARTRLEARKTEKKYNQYVESCMIDELEPMSYADFILELQNGRCEVCLVYDDPVCDCLKSE